MEWNIYHIGTFLAAIAGVILFFLHDRVWGFLKKCCSFFKRSHLSAEPPDTDTKTKDAYGDKDVSPSVRFIHDLDHYRIAFELVELEKDPLACPICFYCYSIRPFARFRESKITEGGQNPRSSLYCPFCFGMYALPPGKTLADIQESVIKRARSLNLLPPQSPASDEENRLLRAQLDGDS